LNKLNSNTFPNNHDLAFPLPSFVILLHIHAIAFNSGAEANKLNDTKLPAQTAIARTTYPSSDHASSTMAREWNMEYGK
jgi:hypothetical protein